MSTGAICRMALNVIIGVVHSAPLIPIRAARLTRFSRLASVAFPRALLQTLKP